MTRTRARELDARGAPPREQRAHGGRGSCSAATVLGASRTPTSARAYERGVPAEAVPREHRGDDTPRGPHGGGRDLQREALTRGSVFRGDGAGVREGCVGGGDAVVRGRVRVEQRAALAREAEREGARVRCAARGGGV